MDFEPSDGCRAGRLKPLIDNDGKPRKRREAVGAISVARG
jgi:hypothetical protein